MEAYFEPIKNLLVSTTTTVALFLGLAESPENNVTILFVDGQTDASIARWDRRDEIQKKLIDASETLTNLVSHFSTEKKFEIARSNKDLKAFTLLANYQKELLSVKNRIYPDDTAYRVAHDSDNETIVRLLNLANYLEIKEPILPMLNYCQRRLLERPEQFLTSEHPEDLYCHDLDRDLLEALHKSLQDKLATMPSIQHIRADPITRHSSINSTRKITVLQKSGHGHDYDITVESINPPNNPTLVFKSCVSSKIKGPVVMHPTKNMLAYNCEAFPQHLKIIACDQNWTCPRSFRYNWASSTEKLMFHPTRNILFAQTFIAWDTAYLEILDLGRSPESPTLLERFIYPKLMNKIWSSHGPIAIHHLYDTLAYEDKSVGTQGVIQVCDYKISTHNYQPLQNSLLSAPYRINALVFNPKKSELVAGLYKGLKIWKRNNNSYQPTQEFVAGPGAVLVIAFHPDGNQFVAGTHRNTIEMYQCDAHGLYQRVQTIPTPDVDLRQLEWSKNDEQFFLARYGNEALLRTFKTASQEEKQLLQEESSFAQTLLLAIAQQQKEKEIDAAGLPKELERFNKGSIDISKYPKLQKLYDSFDEGKFKDKNMQDVIKLLVYDSSKQQTKN